MLHYPTHLLLSESFPRQPALSRRAQGNPSQVGVGEGREGGVGEKERGAAPPKPIPIRPPAQRGGAPAPCGLVASFLWPIRPITSPRQIPVTLRYSDKYPNHSEPFRCPNIVVQYIDLYASTISILLVMSPISYGTPNYLRCIKSYKLIIPIVTELQACGPYEFENYVDMTETCLRSITNSGTWMLILAPTYSTKIFIGQTA